MKRSILICLIAAACGGATGTEKQGTALVTLHGQLTGASTATSTGPVSVAIAWYPSVAANGPTSGAKAIVTQKVTFQGTFPVDFTVQLDGPPPDDALIDLAQNGGRGKAAYGVLIAFEDRNGNGQLDLIPPGGAPVDRIVGASSGDPSAVIPAVTYSIQYLDGTAGPGDQLDVLQGAQGYNLMRAHYWWGVERVPLETSMTIPLTGTAALDILACPVDSAPSFITACGVDPYAGGYQLFGNIFTSSGSQPSSIVVNLGVGSGPVANATVDFNGTPIPHVTSDDGQDVGYRLDAISGSGTLHVSVPGYATESIPIAVLPKTALTMPATLKAGSDLSFSWSAVPGIEFYDIIAGITTSANPPETKTVLHELISATSATIPSVPAGTVNLRVTAVGNPSMGSSPNSYMQSVSNATGVVVVNP
jgi:hypothetical protein